MRRLPTRRPTPLAGLSLAALLAAVVVPSALAAPAAQTLDGVRVKTIELKRDATRGAAAPAGPTDAQVLSCTDDTCGRIPFVWKPAPGVKGDLGLSLHWFYPEATRNDLFLVGGGKVLARCASAVGNTRRLVVAAASLKRGATYTAVMFYGYSFGEKSVLTVSLPAPAATDAVRSTSLDDTEVTSCG